MTTRHNADAGRATDTTTTDTTDTGRSTATGQGDSCRQPDHPFRTRGASGGKTLGMDQRRQADPPEHLSEGSRGWWQATVEAFDLEPHHLRVLQAAAESWDRMQEARELIAREGIVSRGARGQLQPHPAVSVERDSRIAFLRALRELNLDAEQGP